MGLFSSDDVEQNVSNAIEEAKSQRDDGGGEMQAKRKKVEKATQDAENFNQEIERIKDGIEALRSQQKLIQERNENLYRALDVIKEEIERDHQSEEIDLENPDEVASELNYVRDKVQEMDDLEEEIEGLESKIDDYSTTLNTLQENDVLEKLGQEDGKEIEELKEKVEKLSRDQSEPTDRIEDLESQVSQIKNLIDDENIDLAGSSADLKEKVERLEEKVDQKSGSASPNKKVEQDVTYLKNRVQELEDSLDDEEVSENSGKSRKLEEIEKEVESLKDILENQDIDAEELNASKELREDVNYLKKRVEDLDTGNKTSSEDLSTIRARIEKLEASEGTSQTDYKDLKDRISALENKLKDVELLDEADNEIPESFTARLSELEEQIETTKQGGDQDFTDLEDELEIFEMELGVLESRLDKELEDLREEMDLRIKHSENDMRRAFARRTEIQSLWDAVDQDVEGSSTSEEKLKEDIKQELKQEMMNTDDDYVERSEFEELRGNVKEISELLLKIARKTLG